MRYIQYARPGALLVLNNQQISPMPVITGVSTYPDDLLAQLQKLDVELAAMDALDIAEKAGNARTVNIVMLGAVSNKMDLDVQIWEDAIAQCVPAKTIEVNRKAFAAGRAL